MAYHPNPKPDRSLASVMRVPRRRAAPGAGDPDGEDAEATVQWPAGPPLGAEEALRRRKLLKRARGKA